MIALRDISFEYSDSGFSLRIPELVFEQGTKAALVGPSGSGKTTLLHLIAGIRTPRQGRIEIDRKNLCDDSDASRRNYRISTIGFVFQDFELIEYLDVNDNILLPYLINSSMKLDSKVRSTAQELAQSVGLGDKLRRPVDKLSQGEKQRVAICRALLPSPRILLADEPTGNLDPVGKQNILQLLFDKASQIEATLLMVTHDHGLLGGFDRTVDLQAFQVEN